MDHLVCFLPGTLALGSTKGIVKVKAMRENLLSFEDLENLKLAEDLAETCVEMYSVTSTGLVPEIAYFNLEGEGEGGPGGGNKNSKYVDDIIVKPADRHNLLCPHCSSCFASQKIQNIASGVGKSSKNLRSIRKLIPAVTVR